MSNMSNKTDESYELFYNATESVVNNPFTKNVDLAVLDELDGFIECINIVNVRDDFSFIFYAKH